MDSRASEGASRSLVLSALWRGKSAIAVTAVVLGVIGYYVSAAQPDRFEASSTLVLSSSEPFAPMGEYQNPDPTRYVADQMAVMRSGAVLEAAAKTQGVGATAEEIAEDLQLTAASDGSVITVEAGADSAAGAAARANAVVAAYQAYAQAKVQAAAEAAVKALQSQAPVNDDARVQQGTAVGGILARQAQFGDGVETVDPAVAPTSPSTPVPWRDGLVAALVGALLAAGVVMWRRSPGPVETRALLRGAGVPVLGSVDVASGRGAGTAADPEAAAAVLQALDFVTEHRTSGPVLLTGLRRGSGASDVAVGMAVAAVRRGSSVVLVSLEEDASSLMGRLGVVAPPPPLRHAGDATPGGLQSVRALSDSENGGVGRVGRLSSRLTRPADLDAIVEALTSSHDLVLLLGAPVSESVRSYAALRLATANVVVVAAEDTATEVSEGWASLADRLSVTGRAVDAAVISRRRRKVVPAPAGGRQAAPSSGALTRAAAPGGAEARPSAAQADGPSSSRPVSQSGSRES